MSLPGLTRQSRHSGTARISAFTRVFDALCAGPGIQMHALSSFWIPGSLAPRNDRKTIHIVKQPAFVEGFRLRADALRRTKNPPKLASERRRVRRASQRSAALFLCGAGYAVVFGEDPHRPEEEPRARGTPGAQKDPRASTPRDIEACRSPCASPFALVRAVGKACRKSAKPKASRARCLIGLLRTLPGGRRLAPLGDSTVVRPRHSAALL